MYGLSMIHVCSMHVVLDGGVESALQALNTAYGDQIKMNCTPLRSFENFAEQVLDVEHDLARTPFKRIVNDADDQLYWLTFTIGYRGACSLVLSIAHLSQSSRLSRFSLVQ